MSVKNYLSVMLSGLELIIKFIHKIVVAITYYYLIIITKKDTPKLITFILFIVGLPPLIILSILIKILNYIINKIDETKKLINN